MIAFPSRQNLSSLIRFYHHAKSIYSHPRSVLIASIAFSLMIGGIGVVSVLRPLQSRIAALEQEKGHWQEVLASPSPGNRNKGFTIPHMEKLPDLIEGCQEIFLQQGVDVKGFNVERFAQATGNISSANLDYAIVRMHWRGSWQNIEKALEELEESTNLGILVQEVLLDKEGGQGSFWIYFRT